MNCPKSAAQCVFLFSFLTNKCTRCAVFDTISEALINLQRTAKINKSEKKKKRETRNIDNNENTNDANKQWTCQKVRRKTINMDCIKLFGFLLKNVSKYFYAIVYFSTLFALFITLL